MKLIILTLGFLTLSQASDSTPKKDSKASAKRLVESLLSMGQGSLKSATDDFRVNNCKGDAKDWLNLLMTGKGFEANYDFRKGCDAKGSWGPQLDAFFPANFKLKNLEGFNKTNFDILIRFERSLTPKISYTIKNGVLKSPKNTVEFSAKYQMISDLAKSLSAQKIVPQSHEGHIHFTKINGEKVNIKEPIAIKY